MKQPQNKNSIIQKVLEEENQDVSLLTRLKSKYLNQHRNKNFKSQEVVEE